MSRGRQALLVLGAGLLASQAGHLLAYELRFGAAAQHLQSTGAHAYFPALAKTGLGLAALALIAALLIVGAARVAAGRPVAGGTSPSFVRLLAVLYTVQLASFAAQETIEGTFAPLLLLIGMAGQLPVAVAASLALRWLLIKVGPALAVLRPALVPAFRSIVAAFAVRPRPVGAPVAFAGERFEISHVRGPPSF